MSFRDKVIWELYPETHSISDEPVGVLDENNNKIKLDESAIAIKEAELQAEYDAQEYARKRKAEYDALNQLELMSDDSINGTTTHKDAIVTIKAKWPKDNSGPV
jgi:hypothetical protein